MNLKSYETLKEKFKKILVPENEINIYYHDQSIFSITPQLVIKPESKNKLAEIIQSIAGLSHKDKDISLTVRAAGTGLSGGSLNDSVIVDITNLNKLLNLEIDSKKPHITVEPGMFYRDFEYHLEGSNLTMPIFPSSRQWCAIGGMVGNNAAGENTLKYGAQDAFVLELGILLNNGSYHHARPVNFEEYSNILTKNDRASEIYKAMYDLVKEHWDLIQENPVKSSKNVSGYPLWKLLSTSPEKFESGEGLFDLTKIFVGSQGTLGVITSITYRLMDMPKLSQLMVIPVNDLNSLSATINTVLEFQPEKLELFDKKTFQLAQKFPEDFKNSFFPDNYDEFLRIFKEKVVSTIDSYNPEMIILALLSGNDKEYCNRCAEEVAGKIKNAYIVDDLFEEKIYWAIRYSSLALVAQHSTGKKPAAFLEDLVIPLYNFAEFYRDLCEIIQKEELECAIHGHAGNVHLHFYPLLDFTDKNTPRKIKILSEEFFKLAEKYDGSISGEHNDGIIRTPYLHLMYSQEWINLFEKTKIIFDPNNIFNPGKKVFPKFDVADSVRTDNDPGYFNTK